MTKQGRADHSGSASTKVEPTSKAISPGAVSRIGTMVGVGTTKEPMHEGRGFTAPGIDNCSHKSGSQGKY